MLCLTLRTVLVALVTITPALAADCTREGLLAAASYVSAQTAGSTSTFTLSSNLTYRENNKPSTLVSRNSLQILKN